MKQRPFEINDERKREGLRVGISTFHMRSEFKHFNAPSQETLCSQSNKDFCGFAFLHFFTLIHFFENFEDGNCFNGTL
jgi:hypothetical protein